MFSKVVLESPKTAKLVLNPIVETQIDKVLKKITACEGIDQSKVSDQQLAEIKNTANKDMRNAILSLQFFAAGRSLFTQEPKAGKRRKIQQSGETSDDSMRSGLAAKKDRKQDQIDAAKNAGKDYQLAIFHSLGKFLYNKRFDPSNKSKDAMPKQLPYKLMKKNPRPKLYFKHQDVLDQTLLEPSVLSLYLHQNMPQFFGDVCDMADCLESFSHQSEVTSHVDYSFAMQQEINDMEKLSSLICSQAITETNLHCAEKAGSRGMTQMQKPAYFEHLQNYKQNKLALRDVVKEQQLYDGSIFSEDLLIRSQRDAQLTILPFLTMRDTFTANQGFKSNPMSTGDMQSTFGFQSKQTGFLRNNTDYIAQDQAADENYVKEAQFADYLRNQTRQRQQRTQQSGATRFQTDLNNFASSAFNPPPIFAAQETKIPQADVNPEKAGQENDDEMKEEDLLECMSDDIDLEQLADCMEDMSIDEPEDIEDSVDAVSVQRYAH